ncbi:MAG TPA: hypothetical protein EYH35_02330 [Thiotrichaceae bacterium]|nr:hypothetical protein [Thiotrichaceae bacterium]
MKKSLASVAILTLAISTAMQAYAEGSSPVDATNTLPDAKPGQCFAKVIVPAVFEIISEEVVVVPEKETVKIVPASFDKAEKELEIKPAHTVLKVIPATFKKEQETVEIEAERMEWVTSLGRRGIPASPTQLVAAKTSGIDIDSVEAGQCFREYYTAAKFEMKDKQVKIKDEYEKITVKEAEFETVEENIVVREAHTVKSLIDAVYEKIEEKVEIEPAKAVWKKGSGLVERLDNSTGEIMCLVQVPAKYDTFVKSVLKSKAQVEESEVGEVTKAFSVQKLVTDATQEKTTVEAEFTNVQVRTKIEDATFSWVPSTENSSGKYTGSQICLKAIPAKTKVVAKQVLDTAASVEEISTDAKYKTVKVEKLSTAAEVVRSKTVAVTKTVKKRKKTVNERLEWRQVLCKTNMTTDMNKRIQSALKEAGFYNGPIDGSIGRGTLSSVNKYQIEKGLPRGGLTIKVLESLGLQ